MDKRPIVVLKKNTTDKILTVLALAMISFMWIYSILYYPLLPDTIVTHFDFNGKPNDYGSKNTIWILPGITTILMILFKILGKRPDRFNYIVNIDESNAAFQYKSAVRMLNLLALNISFLFSYILYKLINGCLTQHSELDIWFIPILLISVLTPTFYFVYSTTKKKRKV